MNFEYGTSLAVFQDALITKFKQGKRASANELKSLKNNVWVIMASISAPCNLVIRQWALIDLFELSKDHEQSILGQLEKVCENYCYLEGYSYWIYTQLALDIYVEALHSEEIKDYCKKIDLTFSRTSYIGPDKATKWPAPYGDLRHIPLRVHLQGTAPDREFSSGFLTKANTNHYYIKTRYLGMNTHTPKAGNFEIRNGTPYYLGTNKEFEWYNGYDKKYPSKSAEILDTFNPKRIFSLFK